MLTNKMKFALMTAVAAGVLALVPAGAIAAEAKDAAAAGTLNKVTPAAASATAPAKEAAKDDAQQGGMAIKPGDPIVATLNGEGIKRSEIVSFIAGLPDQARQMPIENLFPLAVEQVLNNRIVSEKAKGAKLESDVEVLKLVEQAKGQIIRNVYVQHEVDAQMSDKRLTKAYDKLMKDMADTEEVHARQILVENQDKANEVIKKLDAGSKFEDLAKEYSTGPSAANGGDVGYFAKNEMVPEFADAAFAMKLGEHSKKPVQTQFGWHVIKVEDKRKRPEPKFEDVKPQLEAQVRQEILTDLLTKWQKEAKIQKFDINGEDVKESKAK